MSHLYDVIIIGGGPAGLQAAISAASEGLDTLLLERDRYVGGQIIGSLSLENYAGFPKGISGAKWADSAYRQALDFGAEIRSLSEVVRVQRLGDTMALAVSTKDARIYPTRSIIVSNGFVPRQLGPYLDKYAGHGLYYGAIPAMVQHMLGQPVVVAGGGNSAGQFALALDAVAQRVALVSRRPIRETMSAYLIKRIMDSEHILVVEEAEVLRGIGDYDLEAVMVSSDDGTRTLMGRALFCMTGYQPDNHWLSPSIALDEHGKILTDRDIPEDLWPLERPPFQQETSLPGVFASGDSRTGSYSRVQVCCAEGSIASIGVLKYLESMKQAKE